MADEKWKARAREIVCAEIMMSSHITSDAVAWLEAEIAAALAAAYDEGWEEEREQITEHTNKMAFAIAEAIRARGTSHD